jgi:serine/threonine protein phosphatase 1
MQRTFVIGDIHGAYKALMQCFEKTNFDYFNDKLICLGDVVDGWPQSKECIDELLKIRHLEFIRGNHDAFFIDYLKSGKHEPVWLQQGGEATLKSYGYGEIPAAHVDFFLNSKLYYWEHDQLFVHAGLMPEKPMQHHSEYDLIWKRDLVMEAVEFIDEPEKFHVEGFKNVFVGHTPTIRFESDRPIVIGNLIMLDTGAGWHGRLTMMDTKTGEHWQSDPLLDFYPASEGRF